MPRLTSSLTATSVGALAAFLRARGVPAGDVTAAPVPAGDVTAAPVPAGDVTAAAAPVDDFARGAARVGAGGVAEVFSSGGCVGRRVAIRSSWVRGVSLRACGRVCKRSLCICKPRDLRRGRCTAAGHRTRAPIGGAPIRGQVAPTWGRGVRCACPTSVRSCVRCPPIGHLADRAPSQLAR